MAKYVTTDTELTAVADEIREKTGGAEPLTWPDGFVSAIESISGGGSPTLETVTKSYTPTESQQTETIEAGEGYDGIESVDVTVGAIPGSYVGSGVTRRSSSDLTASGATVTAPAGYYESAASKAVASGTAGTPTASKGTVSNHAVTVTPSVTNAGGYIQGGTVTGQGVQVSASELVSGSETKTANGTYDVTNLAELVVNVAGGGLTRVTGSVTGSGTHTINLTVSKKPIAGVLYRSDWESMEAISTRANAVQMFFDGYVGTSMYTAASTTTLTGQSATTIDITDTSSPAGGKVGYSDGKLYVRAQNNGNQWATALTYNYILYVE